MGGSGDGRYGWVFVMEAPAVSNMGFYIYVEMPASC